MLSLVVSLACCSSSGAALLTAGAEGFAENVTAASSRLGVSVLALALLLAGAEPEEAVTAMLASGQGHPALAAGDAIGANLVILTLTLGPRGAGHPAAGDPPQPWSTPSRRPCSARSPGCCCSTACSAGSRAASWCCCTSAGSSGSGAASRTPPLIGEMAELEEKGELTAVDGADEATGRALLMVLLGLLGMVAGGFLAVRGAEGLVDALGVGESVIGLTVLALATSAEMVALVWAARRRGLTEVVVAGTVGAVAYNATVSLGLAALVSPLALGRHNVILTVAAATAVLPLVLLLGLRSGYPARVGRALLLVVGLRRRRSAFLLAR